MAIIPIDPDTLAIDSAAAQAAGKAASQGYRGRKPYPYGSFDDFLSSEVLDRVTEDLKTLPEAEDIFDRPQEMLKTS